MLKDTVIANHALRRRIEGHEVDVDNLVGEVARVLDASKAEKSELEAALSAANAEVAAMRGRLLAAGLEAGGPEAGTSPAAGEAGSSAAHGQELVAPPGSAATDTAGSARLRPSGGRHGLAKSSGKRRRADETEPAPSLPLSALASSGKRGKTVKRDAKREADSESPVYTDADDSVAARGGKRLVCDPSDAAALRAASSAADQMIGAAQSAAPGLPLRRPSARRAAMAAAQAE